MAKGGAQWQERLNALGTALSGYGSALTGNPMFLQNSLAMQQMQDQRREQQQAKQDQAQLAKLLPSMLPGSGTPETKAFEVNGKTYGQNAPATPLMSRENTMAAMLRFGGPQFMSPIASQAISQLFPQGFTGTLGEGQVAFQNGRQVAAGPAKAQEARKPPAEVELAMFVTGGDENAAREWLRKKNEPKAETRDLFEVLTPEGAKALNLPEGGSYKRNTTTGDVVAIAQPRQEGARFNNDQNKAAGYANTMATAEKRIDDLIGTVDAAGQKRKAKYDPTGIISGWSLSNATASSEAQQYKQAKKEWGLAVLRHESGANVPDSEAEAYAETFFPAVGDSAATIKAKADARKNKIAGIIAASGGAYDSAFGQPKRGGASGSWSIVRED